MNLISKSNYSMMNSLFKKEFRSKTICSPIMISRSDDKCNLSKDCPRKRIPSVIAPLSAKEDSDGIPTPSDETKNEYITSDAYLAPCERRISAHKKDYIINETIPMRETTMSKVEFGVSASDFSPLAFKTVYNIKDAERELLFLNSVHGLPHVVQLLDTFTDNQGHQVLVLPVLKPLKLEKIDLVTVAKYSKQLLEALEGIHKAQIVHMDITPSNLMSDENGDLVLIDFGLSTFSDGKILCPSCGTPGFIAPEVFETDSLCTPKIDIYSAGIIIGTMLEHYIAGCDLQYLGGNMVRSSTTESVISHLKSFLAHFHSPSHSIFSHHNHSTGSLTSSHNSSDTPSVVYMAADFLMHMLHTDPKDRSSATELLKHPFIHCYDNKDSMISEPFIGTDYQSFEERKRVLAYREHQWHSMEESEDDCYYGYYN
ncbi:kinase-like protein [Neoconidiobolus thromboides FSU 785]|nr:kinase-like protein [Neoconidiobolus thromboides FSU 785]